MMKVLQVLPALNSGGVERGTIDFAGELVKQGHQSLVMSSGGTMVAQLEAAGSTHITFAVHQKSLKSLLRVRALRRLLLELDVDIIHVRSRVPAWMIWLAIRKLLAEKRPALVSTFHGLYSVNAYSAVMGRGDQIIAISQCVYDYILENYPQVDRKKITIIHRGVDTAQFNQQYSVSSDWRQLFYQQNPQLQSKSLLLMPGRLSRWKGQLQFIELVDKLIQAGSSCHGVIVGGPTPGKEAYLQELIDDVANRNLQEHITFLGHRTDISNIYAESAVVFNLSQHAEPFGRTVIEALAMGVPVVSYDYGGPAESLRACFPQGLVPLGDGDALLEAVNKVLSTPPVIQFPENFTLQRQAQATLDVYHKALS